MTSHFDNVIFLCRKHNEWRLGSGIQRYCDSSQPLLLFLLLQIRQDHGCLFHIVRGTDLGLPLSSLQFHSLPLIQCSGCRGLGILGKANGFVVRFQLLLLLRMIKKMIVGEQVAHGCYKFVTRTRRRRRGVAVAAVFGFAAAASNGPGALLFQNACWDGATVGTPLIATAARGHRCSFRHGRIHTGYRGSGTVLRLFACTASGAVAGAAALTVSLIAIIIDLHSKIRNAQDRLDASIRFGSKSATLLATAFA